MTVDDVKKGKPMPEGLLKILKKFKIDKKNAVYIGISSYFVRQNSKLLNSIGGAGGGAEGG